MRVPIQELREGCILSEDVFSLTNRPIISQKTVLTKELLDIMKIFLIEEAEVETTMVSGKSMTSAGNMDEAEEEVESNYISTFLKGVQHFKREFTSWQSAFRWISPK